MQNVELLNGMTVTVRPFPRSEFAALSSDLFKFMGWVSAGLLEHLTRFEMTEGQFAVIDRVIERSLGQDAQHVTSGDIPRMCIALYQVNGMAEFPKLSALHLLHEAAIEQVKRETTAALLLETPPSN